MPTYPAIKTEHPSVPINAIQANHYLMNYRWISIVLLCLFCSPYTNHLYAAELVNGGHINDAISVSGEIDVHSFDASIGDVVNISLSDINRTTLYPRITLYDPDGDYVTYNNHYNVASIYNLPITKNGRYTLHVQDFSGGRRSTGEYELHFAKTAGADEHGPLINGGSRRESIEQGDLDTFTFEAYSGDVVNLSLSELFRSDLYPRITLYGPSGNYITYNNHYNVASIYNLSIVEDGTYTVLVQDFSGGRASSGEYEIHFARTAGADEHGALVNGGTRSESIEQGDLDTYTFEATEGDVVNLSLSDIDQTGLYPRMTLYGPDGGYITYNNHYHVASIYNQPISQNGTYTVLVQDFSGGRASSGDYEIHFARSSDVNEHGALINGGSRTETIEQGDLDTFTFDGHRGDVVSLSLSDTEQTRMYPRITLYGPDGAYITYNNHYTVASIYNLALPDDGTYTVLVQDFSGGRASTGDYELFFVRTPEANELGRLSGNSSTEEAISQGDLDTFTFSGSTGNEISLVLTDLNGTFYPEMTLYRPDGSYLTRRTHRSVISLENYTLPDDGIYTLLIRDTSGGRAQTGEYLLEYNVPISQVDSDDSDSGDNSSAQEPETNIGPTANIQSLNEILFGTLISLDGNASEDPDSYPAALIYQWDILQTPESSLITTADIDGQGDATASFLPDVEGEYRLSLTVSDSDKSDTHEISITVSPQEVNAPIEVCDVDESGDITQSDIETIFSRKNTLATEYDHLYDWNQDGMIDILDGRGCATLIE